jgi:hypothetical protein
MKLLSETHDEYKAYLLNQIKVCRQLIKAWDGLMSKPGLRDSVYQFIQNEQKDITNLIGELQRNEQERMANRETTES